MMIAVICEHYKWDYHTYKEQPNWFLRVICEKYEIDRQKEQRERRQQNQQLKQH